MNEHKPWCKPARWAPASSGGRPTEECRHRSWTASAAEQHRASRSSPEGRLWSIFSMNYMKCLKWRQKYQNAKLELHKRIKDWYSHWQSKSLKWSLVIHLQISRALGVNNKVIIKVIFLALCTNTASELLPVIRKTAQTLWPLYFRRYLCSLFHWVVIYCDTAWLLLNNNISTSRPWKIKNSK